MRTEILEDHLPCDQLAASAAQLLGPLVSWVTSLAMPLPGLHLQISSSGLRKRPGRRRERGKTSTDNRQETHRVYKLTYN